MARYTVLHRSPRQGSLTFSYGVVHSEDGRYNYADLFRTRSGAEHAARLLNAGLAEVHPHALVGCRVLPVMRNA